MQNKHTVRHWMMDLVVFVDPEQTVSEALSKMRRRYINSIMVNKSETNPEFGIVTSRDVSDKIVAMNQTLKALTGFSQAEFLGLACAHILRSNVCLHDCPALKINEIS